MKKISDLTFLTILMIVLGLTLLTFSGKSSAEEDSIPFVVTQIKAPDPDPLVIAVPEVFMPQTYDQWTEINRQIVNTTAKHIQIQVQGYGGDIDMGNRFIRALQQAQADGKKVEMIVSGSSYSLHAFITCYADSVALLPGASVLFHQAYSVDSFIFGMINFRNTDLDPPSAVLLQSMFNQCEAKGILTQKEVTEIKAGRDVTVSNVGGTIVRTVSQDEMSIYQTASDIAKVVLYLSILLIIIGVIKRI